MAKSLKKRGQKFFNKFSRASLKASEDGKEHIKKNFIERLSHVANIRLLILEWGLLALALVMLAITQAFWFGDSYDDHTFVDGGVYTEATIGDVNSMNPLFATTNSEKTLSRLMFATLITNDYSGHPGIGLAKSVTATENGKIWKIKLRDNLKWSDDEPLTNEDVLFTVNLIKNPAVNSIYSSNLRGVKVSSGEDGEIIFELNSPYADFITALNIPVLPKHILKDANPEVLVEHSFSRSPVTSGAFSFNALQSGTTAEERIFYLTSNPNYYKGRTMLNSFAVHTYPDKEKLLNAFNAGSATATAELSESDKDKVSANFLRKNSSINSGAFIFFNTTGGITKNSALRSAIRQGINLEELRVDAPETTPLNYPLLPTQITLSSYPKIPGTDFETAKAKISEIADGEELNLNIVTINSNYLPKIAEDLSTQLNNLGIKASVTTFDESQEFITNVISKRSYDILIYEVELGADPDLLPYYHSTQASSTGLNLSNYKNSLVDDLILGARDTTDQDLRIKKYESFLEYWVRDVPAISLFQPNLTYYYNKNIRPFSNDVRLVTPLDRFCDINTWSVVKETRNKTP